MHTAIYSKWRHVRNVNFRLHLCNIPFFLLLLFSSFYNLLVLCRSISMQINHESNMITFGSPHQRLKVILSPNATWIKCIVCTIYSYPPESDAISHRYQWFFSLSYWSSVCRLRWYLNSTGSNIDVMQMRFVFKVAQKPRVNSEALKCIRTLSSSITVPNQYTQVSGITHSNKQRKSIGTFKPLHISRSNSMTLFFATKIVNWIHSVPLNFEDKSGTLMMYETMLIKLDVLGESINMCAQRSHLATFTFIKRLFYWMPRLQHSLDSCNSHNVLALH